MSEVSEREDPGGERGQVSVSSSEEQGLGRGERGQVSVSSSEEQGLGLPAPALSSSGAGPSFATEPLDLSPESIRPFPKGQPRSVQPKRKKIRSCILTENTEAIELLKEKDKKRRIKKAKQEERLLREKEMKEKMKQKKVNRPKKRSLQEESSEEDEVGLAEPILDDSSEYSTEQEIEEEEEENTCPFQEKIPEVNDYILVELLVEEGVNKGSPLHYVAKVIGVEENYQYRVIYLRHSKGKEGSFIFPHIEDEGLIGGDNIKGVLMDPEQPQTKRLANYIKFNMTLEEYNIR